MMERLYHFDTEILQLFENADLGIPHDLLLDRFDFDLMYGMTLVLTPFKIFTKFVQKKDEVTLAYVPKKIDELVASLAPGSFSEMLRECADSDAVIREVEAFQKCLIGSIKDRFGDTFNGDSLAMAARMFLPGPNLFQFDNIETPKDFIEVIKENIIGDYGELLPENMPANEREMAIGMAKGALNYSRLLLDQADPDTDPLEWWPAHQQFSSIYHVVKMYFQIPASSAENERSFSSAGFILDERRTRVGLNNFRSEHRIRRAICSSSSPGQRAKRSNDLIQRFAALVKEREAKGEH
jgi:hypothetical protein